MNAMNCLVIIAHPDDETIWMGGLIRRHARWVWHVLSLCRGDDPDRAPRFKRACEELGARAYISDLDDSPGPAVLSPDLREIKERIARIGHREFDLIFTHGEKGEYTRHQRHEQTHRAVREMVESGVLKGELVFFAYEDHGGEARPHPAQDAQIHLRLMVNEYVEKRRILSRIYNFGEGSFELDAAGSVEAFRLHRDEESARHIRAVLGHSGR